MINKLEEITGVNKEMLMKITEEIIDKMVKSDNPPEFIKKFIEDLNIPERELFLKGFAVGRILSVKPEDLLELK